MSARLASETPDFAPVAPHADGFVTSISTFQELYEQGELKEWIEANLPEPAVAASPGVFHVSRDGADRIGFLVSRYRRQRGQALPTVQSNIEDHKELLRPLIEFFEERGRAATDRDAAPRSC